MAAPSFGKSRFCDDANISASRSYINNALYSRGFTRDPDAGLKFNSADAPVVINLVYDFLQRSSWEEQQREVLTTRVRQAAGEAATLASQNAKLSARVAQLEQAAGVAANHLHAAKQETAAAARETKAQRDQLAKVSLALQHTKVQTAHELRKRDGQILKLKEQLLDGALGTANLGGSRRGHAPGLLGTLRVHGSGTATAQRIEVDMQAAADLQAESTAQLTNMVQEVAQENDALAELLQATLASLETLVPLEETDAQSAPLVTSVAQSIIMLEAQLQVRLTALRGMLEMPNYVPLEEVERRDERISELTSKLRQIETEWSAARNVLKGMTASVLAGKVEGGPQADTREEVLSDSIEPLSKINAAIAGSSSILQETPRAKVNRNHDLADGNASLRALAKTPLVIGQENGRLSVLRHQLSTVKVDARLLGLDVAVPLMDEEATPVRARRARRNRRTTIGLMKQQLELDEELSQVLPSHLHL